MCGCITVRVAVFSAGVGVLTGGDRSIRGSLPSPAFAAPSSKSSRVPLWELRYVAGTQPCSSAVLTNHQPVKMQRS